MGNALRFPCGDCCNPRASGLQKKGRLDPMEWLSPQLGSLRWPVISFSLKTGQVPEGLSQHVESSRKAQANWIFDASTNSHEDILARKYRIRLSGVDAPEYGMPYGEEAKQALLNLVKGKSLQVLVYDEDQYGRLVGDIYSEGVFIQEVLLKKGCVWHYKQYDQCPELAMWEKEARAAHVGLWASSNPQKPWEWRKLRWEDGG